MNILEQFERIRVLIERERYDMALDKINEALTIFPTTNQLHYYKTHIFYCKEDYKNAMESLKEGLSYAPESDRLFYLKSKIELAQRKYKDAMVSIERAIDLEPQISQYFGIKSLILIDTEKFEEAESTAKEGMELDPEDVFTKNMLSLSQTKQGKSGIAIENLKVALEKDPQNAFTQSNLGYQYLQKGDIKKAKEHYAVALQIDPNDENARGGMLNCMKAGNIFFRKMLEFSFFMERIGRKNQFAIIFGIIILVNLVPFLIPFYLLILFWNWFTVPLSDVFIYFDKFAKNLLSESEILFTRINIGLLVAAAVCCLFGFTLSINWFTLALACFVSTIPVYHLDSAFTPKRKMMLGAFIGVFLLSGVVAILPFIWEPFGFNPLNVLVIAVVAYTWANSFVR